MYMFVDLETTEDIEDSLAFARYYRDLIIGE